MKIKQLIYNSGFSLRLGVSALIILFLFTVSPAQSTNQSFPTPITANEISGKIPARDIGDARLTSYFYVFNATQGDVFINVVTSNLNGDIDIFTADNLRPLAKVTLYADASASETGRVIYLRQPVKLIMRIEGRPPNDEAATFRVKFAGSFAPVEATDYSVSETPAVKSDNQTDVRVNSVGTIIEVKPKPTPKPEVVASETKSDKETETSESKKEAKESDKQAALTEKEQIADKEKALVNQNEVKPTLVITNQSPVTDEENKKETVETTTDKTNVKEESVIKTEPKKRKKPVPVKPLPPAALENIRLVIAFKDGTKIERAMSEVLKFGVDKGILMVIFRDGTIGRYSLLDVEKTTIE